MLKINQKKGLYKLYLGRSKIFAVLAVVTLAALAGVWGLRRAGAFEGDYWTKVENGLSITIVSVKQNGLSLVPQEDGEGGYYFDVTNNADAVTVDLRVEGMQPDATYYYYSSERNYQRVDLTSENNGNVITEDLTPRIYFQNEDDCHGGCWVDSMSGKYYISARIVKDGGSELSKNLVLHPASVGSQNIDIVSVRQNNVDLALTNNEYQIVNYNTPVEVTYKFKNLEIGRNYSVDIENNNYDFEADATEKTETRELNLDYTSRHTKTTIYLYGSGNSEQVPLYFKVADANFEPLGDIVIDGISQGGRQLTSEPDISSEWRREYTFEANDAQGLVVNLHSTRVTDDLNYYISYYMNGGAYLTSDEPIVVTGEEMGLGVALPISPAFGMSDRSPFELHISINTTGSPIYDSGSRRVVYQEYGEYQSSDAFYINFYEDENIPQYEAVMYYSGGTIIDSDTISPARHDETHHLLLGLHGENYENERTYDVIAKVKLDGRLYHSETFTATGAQLNEGTMFTLEDLTLQLPEFNPAGGSSGSEGMYEFSLEIDGLRQSGQMYYRYEGWANPIMTFDDGEIVASEGVGGSMYESSKGVTMRRESLDSSKGAVLYYLCSGFEDDWTYNYTLYYNGNTDEDGFSAAAGEIIDQDTLTGAQLNQNGYAVDVLTPSNDSVGVIYTLVITTNGGLVRVVHYNILFTEEPVIDSFKFTADNDSYMQTGDMSYRVAKDTDAVATLTGGGFEDDVEYKLWVLYEGYYYDEGSFYPQPVEGWPDLDDSAVVTGAQLNVGYAYNLDYEEAFDNANFVDVSFVVTDKNAAKPTLGGMMGNGSYARYNIHIDYVNDDEVFRDDGYQINDDGTITDVSQPDESHGPDEPEDVPVDIKTPGDVDVIVDGTGLTVVSRKPTLVIGFEGGHYSLLEEMQSVDNDGEKTNSYDMSGYEEIKVVLKGDGDMDGAVTPADLNRLNRSQISPTLGSRYRALTDLEKIIFDFDGDGDTTPADLNTLNRALISPTLAPRYKEIQW